MSEERALPVSEKTPITHGKGRGPRWESTTALTQ